MTPIIEWYPLRPTRFDPGVPNFGAPQDRISAPIAEIAPNGDGISAHDEQFARAVPIIASDPARIATLERCLSRTSEDFGDDAADVVRIDDAFAPADEDITLADQTSLRLTTTSFAVSTTYRTDAYARRAAFVRRPVRAEFQRAHLAPQPADLARLPRWLEPRRPAGRRAPGHNPPRRMHPRATTRCTIVHYALRRRAHAIALLLYVRSSRPIRASPRPARIANGPPLPPLRMRCAPAGGPRRVRIALRVPLSRPHAVIAPQRQRSRRSTPGDRATRRNAPALTTRQRQPTR